ncbi:diguanylate cyclase domain-containing protein [Photobacterium nomapromontoriensis]|uniref:PAS domain-containing protein n=1 Tax=Photobacterium nomapromontoriensis TaxID=2910237 RepID=UPI003D10A07B
MEDSILRNKLYVIDDIVQLRLALDNVPVYFYIKDRESRYIYANKITLDLFGCSADELIGMDDNHFFPSDTVKILRDIDLRVLNGESTQEEVYVGEPGSSQQVYLEVKTPIYDKTNSKTIVAILGISTDITYQKHIEHEVRSLALTDPLTHLPNRRLLIERIEQAQYRSNRHSAYCAVLFIDLDKFKLVNDIYGHKVGDQLLIEIANRLNLHLRDTDTIARVGGDEFIILLEEVGTKLEQATKYTAEITKKIIKILGGSYFFGEIKLNISASIGINLFIGDTYSPSHIINNADKEMYKQKQQAHKYHI